MSEPKTIVFFPEAAFGPALNSVGQEAYPVGEFFEASPYLNLLFYPEPVRFKRRNPLDPERFQYLDGCVPKMAPYNVPTSTSRPGTRSPR